MIACPPWLFPLLESFLDNQKYRKTATIARVEFKNDLLSFYIFTAPIIRTPRSEA
jgi:hypothetical protein